MNKGIIIKKVEIDISDIACTERLAEIIADADLIEGDVIMLEGGLGAGKTEFSRFLIRKIADDEGLVVPSPTFTIVQGYDFIEPAVFHFDFYRVNGIEDVYEIGIEEALSDGISIIEWPSKIKEWYFDDPLQMEFSPLQASDFHRSKGEGEGEGSPVKRKVVISLSARWMEKLYKKLEKEFLLNELR